MYSDLSETEKSLFNPDFVLRGAKLDGTESEPLFKKGYKYEDSGKHQHKAPGPTRGDWLRSIVKGPVDLLSEGGGDLTLAGSGMGSMHELDTAPGGERLAVLELRRIPKTADYDTWPSLAAQIFAIFREVQADRA